MEGESGRAKSHRRRLIPVKRSPVAAELGEAGQSGVRLCCAGRGSAKRREGSRAN